MFCPHKQINDFFGLARRPRNARTVPFIVVILLWSLSSLSCNQLEERKTDAFYADAVPPRKQEFRWSNGKAPKSLDPALAAAPPETDIVRAIYEGLTDLDAKTLREVPAIGEKWTASDDNRTWTFQLRKDAKWTNGDAVTAADFVRSWKRLAELGEKTAHRDLFNNIVGMRAKAEPPTTPTGSPDFLKDAALNREPGIPFAAAKNQPGKQPENPPPSNPDRHDAGGRTGSHRNSGTEEKFGVEAVSDRVLKVLLIEPDKDFPKLVANSIFRPVFGDGKYFEENGLDPEIITNGPFRISSIGQDGISVVRSEQYWDRASVNLESVRFVPAQSAEKALDAYRAGDLDAVTNADFEPLALKLLSPYKDFRQMTHNALNFYEFNLSRPPFTDRRVREALAIAIERERLTEGEMKGSTEPAFHFLPYDADLKDKLTQDPERARQLLESAGFPEGENFPVIHLVVNRNETQLRIARSVVRMWKQNLNLNAELVVKETAEMDAVRTAGDFDIIRRGVVFPSVDKKVSFAAIFPVERKAETEQPLPRKTETDRDKPSKLPDAQSGGPKDVSDREPSGDQPESDNDRGFAGSAAIFDFRLIPLYFPTSYGLVKPYVLGFDMNGLDAPSLKDVRIDSNWQPKASSPES